eukprot:10438312-Lingulodinium_polyedra.AAC.1
MRSSIRGVSELDSNLPARGQDVQGPFCARRPQRPRLVALEEALLREEVRRLHGRKVAQLAVRCGFRTGSHAAVLQLH